MNPVQIQIALDEANAAYHSLITGTMARVVVDQNGERVEFTATNKQHLYGYILQLQKALGVLSPDLQLSTPPAMFFF